MQEKLNQFRLSVAQEALTETNDKFVEQMVYHGDPVLNPVVRIDL
jgi:hypothetical protein